MAKNPKAKKTSKPGQKPVGQPKAAAAKPSEKTTKGVSPKALEDLMRARRISKKDHRGISDRYGKLLAATKYLDRQAFNVVALGDNMEPERLRQYRDNILHYFDISGLDARADAVTPMTFGPGDEEDEDAEAGNKTEKPEADAKPAGNVTKFRAAAE